MSKILYTGISELITNAGVLRKRGVGVTESDLDIISNAALLWDSAKGIVWLGSISSLPTGARKFKRINLDGRIVAPVLADCHTHLIFGGSRHDEFAMRLSGKTYQEIAQAGGGIQSSVQATRAASEKELFLAGEERLAQVQKLGVGLLEIKSGYGLDWDTEKKTLRVIQRLKKKYEKKIMIQSTFLGAHAFPKESKTDKDKDLYVDEIVKIMLPKVAREKLADACDVFFDEGYFSREQSAKILMKAKELGLKIKLHADELADTGGASLAAEIGALSADHLLKANDKGLAEMAKKGVVAVLLPSTAFYLGIAYADIKKLRKAGVCIALATDFNPGSSPTFHLPFVMSLAVLAQGLTLAEAFGAATYGGAKALGMDYSHGHLTIGKKPKIAVFNCPSYRSLIQQIAHPGLCEFIL